MSTTVLITGANGIVGTAILDGLGGDERFAFRRLDIEDDPDRETVVADVSDYDAIRPAFCGIDAVIHLAVYPPGFTDENWERILAVNVEGTRNVLRAAADSEVESVIFGSTNHVVGMYEREHAPEIYHQEFDLTVDHTSPARPDSTYGVSKLFGEYDGRFFVETNEYPQRFYAIRIASVRPPEYDHPYGDAELGVKEGRWERESEEYNRQVVRLKATWFSRRDCANMIENALLNNAVEFGIFYGVSDNDRRWFDIDHAREILGYGPQDNAEKWDGRPGRDVS